jgi:hypothetical protein
MKVTSGGKGMLYLWQMIRNLLVLLLLTSISYGQRLAPYSGINEEGQRTVYTTIKSYFGVINAADSSEAGKTGTAFIYMKVNDTLPAIAVRLVQPVPSLAMPDKGDIAEENYYLHERDPATPLKGKISIENKSGDMWLPLTVDSSSEILLNSKKQLILPGIYRISLKYIKNLTSATFLIQAGTMLNTTLNISSNSEEL